MIRSNRRQVLCEPEHQQPFKNLILVKPQLKHIGTFNKNLVEDYKERLETEDFGRWILFSILSGLITLLYVPIKLY